MSQITLGPVSIFNCVGDITSATLDALLLFDARVRGHLAANSESEASALIRICSRGGETDVGAALYHVLRGLPVPVITVAFGAISSAGVIAFCGGEQRIVIDGTRVTLHAPQWTPDGSYSVEEIRRALALMETRVSMAVHILATTMAVPEATVARELEAGKAFTAAEAVEARIATAHARAVAFTPVER